MTPPSVAGTMSLTAGVVAVQGDVEEHAAAIERAAAARDRE
ncbi:pyridoxal 5'-phosphate synthase glutaminase subunit PdxT, partial [Natrinema soli]